MIQIWIKVVESRVRIHTSGFSLSSSRIYSNKEALARLRDAYPTWELLVPNMIAYLVERFPTEDWCIRVFNDGVELRRFESALATVVPEVPRVSRYSRKPVI
jgi:hypothetical protein